MMTLVEVLALCAITAAVLIVETCVKLLRAVERG